MKNLIAILLISLICSCANTNSGYMDSKERSTFVQNWFDDHLKSLKEKPLQAYPNKSLYRFTWVPTFHNAMTFRLAELGNGGYQFFASRTDGAAGYEVGKLTDKVSFKFPRKKATSVIDKLENECKFWDLPVNEESRGLDGSEWIFEAVKEGKYHVVERWSPDDGCLREVGEKLIEMSKIKVDEVY